MIIDFGTEASGVSQRNGQLLRQDRLIIADIAAENPMGGAHAHLRGDPTT